MNYSELIEYSQGKTKVVLFGIHPKISEILRYILDYNGKTYDFVNEENTLINPINKADFFIIETNDEQALEFFQPTILFIGSSFQMENYEALVSKITAGGILVYPDFISHLDRTVLQSLNYYKKYPYNSSEVVQSGNQILLNTDFGKLPLPISEQEEGKDIQGAMYFCQQLGVMEDDFYDALSSMI